MPATLYEDLDLMVIDKPAGWVVNQAQTVSGETLQSWVTNQFDFSVQTFPKDWQAQVPPDFDSTYGTPEEIFAQRQGMVHRLDKDTSGVLLWAKHPGALVNLLAQFKHRNIEKEYLAVVHGRVEPQQGELIFPLGRNNRARLKMSVVAEGRIAKTRYQIEQYTAFSSDLLSRLVKTDQLVGRDLKQLSNAYSQGFSVIRCWPQTGRKHQLRVHFSHIRHPIVGDKLYLGHKRLRFDLLWVNHHQLMAQQIKFDHPRSLQRVAFKSNLSLASLDFLS